MNQSIYTSVGQITMCCLLALTGCSATSTERTLNASEVKSLFGGKTATAFHEIKKVPVNLYYDTNGEVRGIFSSGKKGSTQWQVKDNGYICLKMKGPDACFAVVEKNGQYQKHLVKAGKKQMPVFSFEKFMEGNVNQH